MFKVKELKNTSKDYENIIELGRTFFDDRYIIFKFADDLSSAEIMFGR